MNTSNGSLRLPNEVLLEIFSLDFNLTGLIKLGCVCALWRQLLPYAKMPPELRDLLSFYRELCRSEAFISQREEVVREVVEFNREEFLEKTMDGLKEGMSSEKAAKLRLPQDYITWITEWPSRAAIGCLWPGLRRHRYSGKDTGCVQRVHDWAGPGFPDCHAPTPLDGCYSEFTTKDSSTRWARAALLHSHGSQNVAMFLEDSECLTVTSGLISMREHSWWSKGAVSWFYRGPVQYLATFSDLRRATWEAIQEDYTKFQFEAQRRTEAEEVLKAQAAEAEAEIQVGIETGINKEAANTEV
ncbi:hypothetical protein M422DRAFT_65016 [Sphaerobolus stellatus SS14]|nr:hypothetical protein M422DRAFT_65016 [Sphaerobolus stellatus SS14]